MHNRTTAWCTGLALRWAVSVGGGRCGAWWLNCWDRCGWDHLVRLLQLVVQGWSSACWPLCRGRYIKLCSSDGRCLYCCHAQHRRAASCMQQTLKSSQLEAVSSLRIARAITADPRVATLTCAPLHLQAALAL
jgi:hypothetical protein